MVTIDNKIEDTKLVSSEAYLLKLGENLLEDFEFKLIFTFFFCKNSVLNKCRYLTRFYTCKKINNIFLKSCQFLLRMPKIIDIGEIVFAEKCN